MPAITSENVANAIVKLIASEVAKPLVGNLIMAQLVDRSYEPELAQAGDVVNIPLSPTMSVNNLAEAGSVTTQANNLGNAQIRLTTHAEASFEIPDVTKVIAGNLDLLKTNMQPALVAHAESIETALLALYPQFTANTAVGTGNTALTEATIDSAENALFKAKVPPGEPKNLVLSADAYSVVRQLDRFTSASEIGSGAAIATGQVGMLKDLRVFRSQYVAKPSTTTYNLAFAKPAIGLAMRRLPQPLPGTGAIAEYVEYGGFGFRVVMSYQPNTLAQRFTVDCLYGVGVIRNPFGVQVLS